MFAAALRFWALTELGMWPQDAGNYVRMSTWLLGAGGVPMNWEPPVTSVIVAASFVLFGIVDFVAIASIGFFSVLTVIVTYLLGKELFSERVGLIAAAVLASMEYHIVFSRIVMADNVLAFFYALSLLFFVKALKKKSLPYYALFGISASISFLTKYVGFQIIAVALIFLAYRAFMKRKLSRSDVLFNAKGMAVALAIVVVTQLMWTFALGIGVYMSPDHATHFSLGDLNAAYLAANGPDIMKAGVGEYFYIYGVFTGVIEGEGVIDPWFFLSAMWTWMTPVALVFFAIGLYLQFAKGRKEAGFIIPVYFLFIFLFFSVLIGYRGVRVIVPLLPAVALISAVGFSAIKRKDILCAMVALAVISGTLMSANTLLDYHNGYRQLGDFMQHNLTRQDLVFYTGMPQALFYHETDTGNWVRYGDTESFDNITYAVLISPYKYENRYLDAQGLERALEPAAVYVNEDPFMELYGHTEERKDSEYIRIYRIDDESRVYFRR